MTYLLLTFWLYPISILNTMETVPNERSSLSSSTLVQNQNQQNLDLTYYNFLLAHGASPAADEYFDDLDKGKIHGNPSLVPYKNPFNPKNFVHAATTTASLGIGEIIFEFGIKELFTPHPIVPLLITSNVLFDLLSATGGFLGYKYVYKKWLEQNFKNSH